MGNYIYFACLVFYRNGFDYSFIPISKYSLPCFTLIYFCYKKRQNGQQLVKMVFKMPNPLISKVSFRILCERVPDYICPLMKQIFPTYPSTVQALHNNFSEYKLCVPVYRSKCKVGIVPGEGVLISPSRPAPVPQDRNQAK